MPEKKEKRNNNLDRYIIRKYVFAKSASDAIRKDKNTKPMDIWIDEDWKKNNSDFPKADAIGFNDGE